MIRLTIFTLIVVGLLVLAIRLVQKYIDQDVIKTILTWIGWLLIAVVIIRFMLGLLGISSPV